MPGCILFIIFMLTLLAINWWEYVFPLAALIIHGAPMAYEESQRILDLIINYSSITLFMMGILIFVMGRYNSHSRFLHDRSIKDNLTVLYNKLYLEEDGKAQGGHFRRTVGHLSLMFIDLNNFRRIVDKGDFSDLLKRADERLFNDKEVRKGLSS